MSVYIIVDENNIVLNNIDWDGNTNWSPPPGTRAIQYDGPSWAGALWDGTVVVDPNPPRTEIYTGANTDSVGPTSIG